jgi:hypothetical protein
MAGAQAATGIISYDAGAGRNFLTPEQLNLIFEARR